MDREVRIESVGDHYQATLFEDSERVGEIVGQFGDVLSLMFTQWDNFSISTDLTAGKALVALLKKLLVWVDIL